MLDTSLSKKRKMVKTWSLPSQSAHRPWHHGRGQWHASQRGSIIDGLAVPTFSSQVPLRASLASLAVIHLFPPVQYGANDNCPSGSTVLETPVC